MQELVLGRVRVWGLDPSEVQGTEPPLEVRDEAARS